MGESDEALVELARSGTLEAFDRLMRRYERLVCRVALKYVGSRHNALDVTQNVFLKVWGNLDAVRADGMFKPWLLRIAYHESINWLRRNKRHAVTQDLDAGPEPEAGITAPDEAVLLDEDLERVARGLAALNPKYRLALSLRYAEGLRVREIAEVLECSEGVVKSLLFRGVRKIRRHVGVGEAGSPG